MTLPHGSLPPEPESGCPREPRASRAVTPVNLGAVYTPAVLARWVARQLLSHLPPGKSLRILDPACGDGALLKAAALASWESGQAVELLGVDLDSGALGEACEALHPAAEFYPADALNPGSTASAGEGWRALLGEKLPVDGVIANPPWGADIRHSRPALKALGYALASGQFDSFDLFIEISLSLVKDGGVLAFIIPDALFLPEHTPLRRLLLRASALLLVARLGEGFFPGVFRGTAVVIFRKGAAAPEHSVSCFRLTREWRSKILSGAAALDEAQESLAHPVRQERFARDPLARWDIDVQEGEERVLRLLSFSAIPWGRWLKSGRGVELSKWGKVVLCPGCGRASPLPRPPRLCLCGACGRRFMSDSVEQQQITRPLRGGDEGWHPLIVGEDVDRYRCIPGREIRLGVEGINYKNSDTFRMRKLLVRKTGVGIKAAIDESGAYTNQVVFHYTPAGDAPPFLLDYLLGVLCSRVLFAYHLKRLGENEWRSHPYVTQKVIEALPVPEIREGTWQWAQAQAIAEAAGRRSSVDRNDGEDDLQVERLVAGLYGLSTEDCAWVLGVLDGAQSLEPMRALRLPDPALLRPVRVP